MKYSNFEIDAVKLVKRCEKAPTSELLALRPEVDRVIRTLASRHQPVPPTLRQLKVRLEEEALDEMFNNMPV